RSSRSSSSRSSSSSSSSSRSSSSSSSFSSCIPTRGSPSVSSPLSSGMCVLLPFRVLRGPGPDDGRHPAPWTAYADGGRSQAAPADFRKGPNFPLGLSLLRLRDTIPGLNRHRESDMVKKVTLGEVTVAQLKHAAVILATDPRDPAYRHLLWGPELP